MPYKQQKFTSSSSRGGKSEIRVPACVSSVEDLFMVADCSPLITASLGRKIGWESSLEGTLLEKQ